MRSIYPLGGYCTPAHLVLFVLLVGCGQESDNHGLGWHFDEQGTTGVRVRYLNDGSMRLAEVEQAWIETRACVGLPDEPGPLVIFAEKMPEPSEDTLAGIAFFDTFTVVIADSAEMRELRACCDPALLKHEYVHLLLFRRDNGASHSHFAPEFSCQH